MSTSVRILFVAVLSVGAASRAEEGRLASKSIADKARHFETQVEPILRANCLACHGLDEKKIKGGLVLLSRDDLIKGGESGPAISPEEPESSLLLDAINHRGPEMPPKGKLPAAQIEILTDWVKMGAPWSSSGKIAVDAHGAPKVYERARNFWAFRPVVRPEPPKVKNGGWVRNPIDAFVLAKLEEKGFAPSAPASRTTLLRRAYYTLTGLPPTPEQVDAFLADLSTDAYEKVVDSLLNSKRYGEHWGRHWLDLVRYAETNSFERDGAKPFVWRYRDYVIRSFNEDKPYDRFIKEQIAGDELDRVTPETIIAAGFHRLGLWDDEPADPLLAYYDGLDDIVSTAGQAFLGLTVGCARCHDHKIDPFPQKDYYKLLAFFRGVRHYGERGAESVATNSLRSIGDPDKASEQSKAVAAHNLRLAATTRLLRKIEDEVRPKLEGGEKDDFKYPKNRVAILRKHAPEHVSKVTVDSYEKLRTELDRLQNERPPALEQALTVKEDGPIPKETFVLIRGNPQGRGEKVEPGFPEILTAPGSRPPVIPTPAPEAKSSGRRRVLAEWLADPSNPLTARVMVNRVWQYHFGRGIVRSSSNFGYAGAPPTHPELLDYLASEFVKEGMTLKSLHRLILTSNAFQTSSTADPRLIERDPDNDLLGRFDLRRLSAEEVRDSVLAVCGNLNLKKTEGPSVYPVIPREVLAGQSMPGNGWGRSTPEEAASRSVFAHVKRSLAVPILAAFDAADPDGPCPVRFNTTQPTQALAMLNGEFLNEQARVFATDSRIRSATDRAGFVRLVLNRATQRPTTSAEIARGTRFLADLVEKDKLSEPEARRRFCLLALNLNEFLYVD